MRALAVVLVLTLAGCAAPKAPASPPTGSVDLPDADVANLTGLELVASVAHPLVNDLAFRPGFVYAASHTAGALVVDVSDPEAPEVVANVPCNGIDVGVVDLAQGRRVMLLSHSGDDGCPDASPTGGVRLVDVTDPTDPVVLGQVALESGSHAHTPWGDTGLVVSSRLTGVKPDAKVDILDVSDPDDPVVAAVWADPEGIGCHDVFADPARSRAFCAGTTETVIWNMTDPLAPSPVARIRNPLMQVHHWAMTSADGTLLVVGDESGGFPGPACTPPAPVGALWAYDVTDPANPVQKGYFVPPRGVGPAACTAHYFNFVGDTRLLVGAFYTAGTVVVDFTDPVAPVMVDQQIPSGSNAWSSYWNPHDGYVYVGDWGRGLDVMRFVG